MSSSTPLGDPVPAIGVTSPEPSNPTSSLATLGAVDERRLTPVPPMPKLLRINASHLQIPQSRDQYHYQRETIRFFTSTCRSDSLLKPRICKRRNAISLAAEHGMQGAAFTPLCHSTKRKKRKLARERETLMKKTERARTRYQKIASPLSPVPGVHHLAYPRGCYGKKSRITIVSGNESGSLDCRGSSIVGRRRGLRLFVRRGRIALALMIL
jgi:hypothetical protein